MGNRTVKTKVYRYSREGEELLIIAIIYLKYSMTLLKLNPETDSSQSVDNSGHFEHWHIHYCMSRKLALK